MVQKIFLTLVLLSTLLLAQVNEFGMITALSGNVLVSRNSDLIQPSLSSRIYLDDYIFVSNNATVKIRTNFDNYLVIKDASFCQIIGPKNFYFHYGTYYLKSNYKEEFVINTAKDLLKFNSEEFVIQNNKLIEINDENRNQFDWGYFSNFKDLTQKAPEPKSLQKALRLTAVFPGLGHHYLESKPKNYFMLSFSAYLLYNILTINPSDWHSEENYQIMYNQREQFKQIYLVYWGWAMLDTFSEAKLFNKKIEFQKNSWKLSFYNNKFNIR